MSWKLTVAVVVLWAVGFVLPLLAFDGKVWFLSAGAGLAAGIAVGWVFLGVELSVTGGLPLSPALEARVRYLGRWAIGLLAISIFLVAAVWDWKQAALAFGTSVQSAIWVSMIVLLFGHERRTIERPR